MRILVAIFGILYCGMAYIGITNAYQNVEVENKPLTIGIGIFITLYPMSLALYFINTYGI